MYPFRNFSLEAFSAQLTKGEEGTKVSAEVDATFTFHLRIELKGKTELPAEAVEKINTLLQAERESPRHSCGG